MTSVERRVSQETGWLAGGPLLSIATIRRTTDTFLLISHTTNSNFVAISSLVLELLKKCRVR